MHYRQVDLDRMEFVPREAATEDLVEYVCKAGREPVD
jgi:hypothetical protein